ncbi:MAG TPA: hypothetical protein VEJ86_01715 [Candidatus Binataceae bacterium]|nr:hypothetical protein [Candidatus Binataceae bacterium]
MYSEFARSSWPLESESIMPAQFFAGQRKPAEPLKRLMLAVLLDAVRAYQVNFGAMRGERRLAFAEADWWLFHARDRSPFSLETVCDSLSISPATVRRTVAAWRGERSRGVAAAPMVSRGPVVSRGHMPRHAAKNGASRFVRDAS